MKGGVRRKTANRITYLNKPDFYRILEADGEEGEFRSCHKLTKFHLEVQGQETQRVRLAVQVLSGSVANMFEILGMKHKAEIVHIINNFFDVCDSRAKFSKGNNRFKCGLGVYEEDQQQALKDMIELMESIQWKNKRGKWSNTKKPFQKGKKSFLIQYWNFWIISGFILKD